MWGGPPSQQPVGRWLEVSSPKAGGIDAHRSPCPTVISRSGEAHRCEPFGQGYGWNPLK